MRNQNSKKLIGKKSLRFLITTIIVVALVLASVMAFTGCGDRGAYRYSLSRTTVNRIFASSEQRFLLPEIQTEDPNYSVEWSVLENSIETNPVAFLDPNGINYTIGLIDVRHDTTRAHTIFRATVAGSDGIVTTLDYTVNVTDMPTAYLTHISSSKHGHINYTNRGIARTRVFGLYDIRLPDGTATAGHWEDDTWIDGTWRDVEFANSSSTFELMWNALGDVELDVWLEEFDEITNQFVRVDANNSFNTNVARLDYDADVDQRRVTVNFVNAGTVRFIAESVDEIRPGFRPRYEFTYEIVNAVNTYDFDDIKLLERLARYTYIADGVRLQNGDFQERIDGAEIAGTSRNLGNYINPDNYNGLLSLHFNTTETPTPQNYLVNTPATVQWEGYRDVGSFFDEFAHWAPSFRFKDIVIRSTHRDRNEATRANGRMETWAEGTWFFGSVFGNGNHLDATPYTRGEEGRYRNTHSMRGMPDGGSLGFEGRRFFPGYGWGDIYAFYMLANNSILDNLTLTGENIPQGATAIRLNQFNKIGVVGTSMLMGRTREFSIGRAHSEGRFVTGLYIEGITIQNSVIEKGLTLIGAGFAPNASNPITVNTSVLRFGGFTGILGTSFGGGIGDNDPENGEAVRSVVANHGTTYAWRSERGGVTIPHPHNDGGNFGNFVVARNNIFHDISVSPILTMPSRSGSHISIEGNDNHFFTWLRSNDIQFPEMTDPYHEGFARVMGGSINGMIPALLNRVFTNNNNEGITSAMMDGRGHSFPQGRSWARTLHARYEQPNGVFLVNIPVIIVTDEGQNKNNFVTFENSILSSVVENTIGLVSDHAGGATPPGLNQRFDLLMLQSPQYANIDPSIADGLIRVTDMNTESINARVANMVPTGTNVPTIVSGAPVNLTAGVDSTGDVVLFNAGARSFAGHRIMFRGREVALQDGAYDPTNSTITVRIEDLIEAGADSFGIFNFDIVNIAARAREPVSSFTMVLQGSRGGTPTVVVPGAIDFTNANRYVDFSISLPDGGTVNSVTIAGDLTGNPAFQQDTSLDFSYQIGILRLLGMDLRHGNNMLIVQTSAGMLRLTVDIVRQTIALEARPVDLVEDPDFYMDIIGPVDVDGLRVSIDGRVLTAAEFTLYNSTITVPNAVIRAILGNRYSAGTSMPVLVTNNNALELSSRLNIIERNIAFGFAANAISTPYNTAAGIDSPFINIASGHKHYTDIYIELTNHIGDNLVGVSFADTMEVADARAQMIRFSDIEYSTVSLPDNVTRIIIPASAAMQAGLVAGNEHRIWVFTTTHGTRTAENQTIRIFNDNHVSDLDRAPSFISNRFMVDFEEAVNGAQIGFSSGTFAYLYDLFVSELVEVPLPDDFDFLRPILEALGAMRGGMIYLPSLGVSSISVPDSQNFSQSTFSDTNTILAVRSEDGDILYEFTRDEIFSGDAPISFIFAEGGTRLPETTLSAEVNIGFLPVPILVPVPMPAIDAFYVTGFDISREFLELLGNGEFTIEVISNFNISYTTLVVTGVAEVDTGRSVNPWVIIGPILAVLVVGAGVFVVIKLIKRRRVTKS